MIDVIEYPAYSLKITEGRAEGSSRLINTIVLSNDAAQGAGLLTSSVRLGCRPDLSAVQLSNQRSNEAGLWDVDCDFWFKQPAGLKNVSTTVIGCFDDKKKQKQESR